jgi:DNA mismatch repair protein MutL
LDLKRSSLKERIEELFPEVRGKLIYVEAENSLFKLKAYLSKPEVNYPRRIKQYTFVNGRAVLSYSLYHAIDEAYQGLIEGKKFPVVFLFVEMEPQLLDVNIHPTKREIKFRREREVHDLLRGILRDELVGKKIITTMEIKEEAPSSLDQEGKFYQPTIKELEQEFDLVREVQKELLRMEASGEYLVYRNKFIIWLDEEGINILDQHAGCEKILYEKLKDAWEGKGIEVQRLLLPEVLNLDLKTATFLRQNLDLFSRIGFEIREFGENSFIIQTKPQLLKGKPKDIIKEVISELLEKEEIKDMFEAIIASLACHSAVKSGDELSKEEIHKLVQEVKDLDRPYCPHGRPAWIVIKWEDIEKRFGRR